MAVALGVILTFIVATLWLAFRSKRPLTVESFALSKQTFGFLALCGTTVATVTGSGVILGTTEQVYLHGAIYALCLFIGQGCQLLLLAYLAPRIRFGKEKLSIGDILEPAYGPLARYASGVFWLLFCMGILSVQLIAMGRVISLILPIPEWLNTLIGSVVVVAYCSLCGIRAVVTTDLLQVVVIFAGLIGLIVAGFYYLGGVFVLTAVPDGKIVGLQGLGLSGSLFLLLSFTLGDLLIPPMIQRVQMASSDRDARRAMSLSCLFIGVVAGSCALIGLIAYLIRPDVTAAQAVNELLLNVFPYGLNSLAICAILAAIMSSADSYLNTAAIAALRDALPLRIQSQMTCRQQLQWLQLSTVVIGIFSLGISFLGSGLLKLLLATFTLWGPVVVVPTLLALFYPQKSFGPRQFFLPALVGFASSWWFEWFSGESGVSGTSLMVGVASNALLSLCLLSVTHNKLMLTKKSKE